MQGVSCLTVTPSVDVTELLPNQEFVYTTLYRNDCPFALNNPTLRVFLPNEVDFLASSNPFFIREGNKLSYNIGVLPVGGQGSVAITGYVRKDAELGDTLVFNSTLEFIDFNNQVQSATSYLTAVLGGDITRSFTANIGDALGNIFSSIWFWFLLLLLIIAGIVWFFATRSRNNTVVVAADRRDDPLRALRDA